MQKAFGSSLYTVLHSKLKPSEMAEVEQLVRSRSKRFIGEGATARVWGFPEGSPMAGYVLRVQVESAYCIESYVQWAKFCTENPRNKYLPKIPLLAEMRTQAGDLKKVLTVMERLESVKKSPIGQSDNGGWPQYLEDYLADHYYWNERELGDLTRAKMVTRRGMQMLRDKLVNKSIFVNDIHDENVMYRPSTNTLVITDPVC